MAALLPYIVALILVPLISIYIVVSFNRKNRTKNLPPGSKGWPILGETMAFALSGPQKFIKDRMEKHSPEVFRTSLFGETTAIFCGPQGNKFLFMNENKLVTSWWPKSIKNVFMLPEYAEGSSVEASARQRSIHHDIVSPEALKQYIAAMDEMAHHHLDRNWTPYSVVKAFPLSKKYTFELACRLFLNVVDPERIKKLSDPFTTATDGMLSMPIDLPGMAYSRALKAGKMVHEELMRIIRERKEKLVQNNESKDGEDLLSKLLLMRDEEGQLLSEREICNIVCGLLVASFETTSCAITAVVKYLAELPHIYEEVLKEQMEIVKSKGLDELLTWEDIERMKYSWNVARESLRLMSPARGAFREATTDFTYAGFTIPKGWKAFWTIHSSHEDPKYFPEPEKFDPARFEGTGPAPYSYVPFGGGPRMCPGKEYTRLEILVFMHNLVTKFRLKKAIPNEKIVVHGLPRPVDGLPVHLYPHEK